MTDIAPEAIFQFGVLFLSLALFFAVKAIPIEAVSTKLRSKVKSSKAQASRHFLHGAHLLSRAKSTSNRANSISLAHQAISEANKSISLQPRDAAAYILKALAFDLQGHKLSAIKSLDLALSPPAVRSLADRERGDALYKRAEIQLSVNKRRRVESAMGDLVEAVKLSSDNSKAYDLLGRCYEMKGLKDEAQRAFETARKVEERPVVRDRTDTSEF
ncbi:hypothetical protein RJ641_010047 [Dillenia turbinata]|uniref:Uncharacterized protein n=1 Tax=Dillenia turbinata TaxID=194707 RepID=A0AAN8VAW2_9MAGN